MYSTSAVSKITGISKDTLRYYERIGVVPISGRKKLYSERLLDHLLHVNSLKKSGLTLEEITKFLNEKSELSIMKDKELSKEDLLYLNCRISFMIDISERMKKVQQELDHTLQFINDKMHLYKRVLRDIEDLKARELK
ncbi:MerR family transcriptional regulator [Bacillus massilinigeriensis]|uniref:MerR family transcriptional regulator n=1 Tax=Bacillus massilionigeriensis TaxID=1805475 RepID=UPI00096B03AC|nr:MerR family transcriptional regulator [Bacillus massilionigeriensis]